MAVQGDDDILLRSLISSFSVQYSFRRVLFFNARACGSCQNGGLNGRGDEIRSWNAGAASDATERESVLSMAMESEASNMATKVYRCIFLTERSMCGYFSLFLPLW